MEKGDITLAIPLPADVKDRLGTLAKAAGQTTGDYVREAIIGHLADPSRRGQDVQVNETPYRMLAENSSDIIFLHDIDGRLSYISSACRKVLGYEPEELLTLPVEELIHPDDMAELTRHYAKLSAEQSEFTTTHRLRRKDGIYSWVEADIRLLPGAVDPDAKVIGTARDVTQRRFAEEKLRESEARFRGQFDTAAHGIALVSPEGRWLRANPALCRMLGYTEEELLATDFQAVTHPDDLGADLAQVQAMLAGEIESYLIE